MSIKLLSSPLQGFTDFRFRNAFNTYFGGVDVFYAPYIRLNGKMVVKNSYQRDLLPKNNSTLELIPQVMTANADEFLFVANYVQELGYKELNWNLGCPYPMVTNRGMGSGLIKESEKISEILHKVHNESDIIVSMKMRLGYESINETLELLPKLDQFPLKNIAVHARLGKQLYKGEVNLDAFEELRKYTNHLLFYNGDINSVSKYREAKERFPFIENWMLGRGIIADPFLAQMIKDDTLNYPENRIEVFSKFHDSLFEEYRQALSGDSHLLMKMLHFWEYFITSFKGSPKGLKKIKKAKNIRAYDVAVRDILEKEG